MNIMSFNTKYKRCYIIAAITVVCLLLCVMLYPILRNANPTDQERIIYIDNDDTVDSVMDKTQCRMGWKILMCARKYRVRPGRYEILRGERVLTLYRKMMNGRQSPVRFTLPNVRTLDRLAAQLERKFMNMDSAGVASSFADSAFCAQWGYTVETLPALFIPDTYEIWWNTTLEDFMKRMLRENKRFWEGRRDRRADEIGMSHEEIITLASIVDEETSNNGEKPMVAGMYIQRLRTGMPLQADPTVKFALKDFAKRRIYNADLMTPSPYNTYRNKGLPPGPIRIPTVAGIDAVLNYIETECVYMCAKEDFSGTHNFARTYEEHLLNAKRYTQALNSRNIR